MRQLTIVKLDIFSRDPALRHAVAPRSNDTPHFLHEVQRIFCGKMFQRVFNQHTFKKIIVTIQPISEVNFPVRMLLGLAEQCSQEVERKEVGV